jgi:hypothetical protein
MDTQGNLILLLLLEMKKKMKSRYQSNLCAYSLLHTYPHPRIYILQIHMTINSYLFGKIETE